MAYVLAYIYAQLLLIVSCGVALGTFGEFISVIGEIAVVITSADASLPEIRTSTYTGTSSQTNYKQLKSPMLKVLTLQSAEIMKHIN